MASSPRFHALGGARRRRHSSLRVRYSGRRLQLEQRWNVWRGLLRGFRVGPVVIICGAINVCVIFTPAVVSAEQRPPHDDALSEGCVHGRKLNSRLRARGWKQFLDVGGRGRRRLAVAGRKRARVDCSSALHKGVGVDEWRRRWCLQSPTVKMNSGKAGERCSATQADECAAHEL